MKNRRYDVIVAGAGLAGLQAARLLALGGAKVLLADARRNVTDAIRTTGIFVRRTFDDFPLLHPFLGPSIRSIALHSPGGRTLELESAEDEFRAGRMQPLYAHLLEQAVAAGVEWSPRTVFLGSQPGRGWSTVSFADGRAAQTRFLAGADGSHSRVARDLGLDRNHRFLTGLEDVFPSASPLRPRFDCWIDPAIAPGYLAWLVDDGEAMHAGVAGRSRRFDPVASLELFERRLRAARLLRPGAALERRGGAIPVNGILRRIGCARGLLLGDAAGAVSPLTAGGLDACMRLSSHAASVLLDALDDPGAMRRYDGAEFRSRFTLRLALRHAFDLASRSRFLVELGFAVGTNPLVQHVFFGRSSFPDVRVA